MKVGLSSIDGVNASENSTSQSIDFEPQRWCPAATLSQGVR